MAGDSDSNSDEVFARYSRQLADLAHRHLSARLRARVDGEDIAQSVLRTFFRRSQAGEFQLNESTDLWKLLVKITITKVHNRARHHGADKRDIGREEARPTNDTFDAALSREPGPAEAAELAEQLERLLADLPTAHREIFGLTVQGYTRTEIAEELKLSRMTVHRVLAVLRSKLRDA